MKQDLVKIFLLLGMGLGPLLWPQNSFGSTKSLVFRADEWCPYNCNPRQAERPGYMVEVLKKILEPRGYQIIYELSPWPRALEDARKGAIAGVFGADKVEGEGLLLPKNSFGKSETGFFVKADNPWRYKTESSINGLRIGVIQGYSYNDTVNAWMQRKHPSLVFMSGDTPLANMFKMLEAKRLQAIYENKNVLQNFLVSQKLDPKDYTFAGTPDLKGNELFIALSPKIPEAPQIQKWLDEGLLKLRNSGELQNILSKYGLQDWQAR